MVVVTFNKGKKRRVPSRLPVWSKAAIINAAGNAVSTRQAVRYIKEGSRQHAVQGKVPRRRVAALAARIHLAPRKRLAGPCGRAVPLDCMQRARSSKNGHTGAACTRSSVLSPSRAMPAALAHAHPHPQNEGRQGGRPQRSEHRPPVGSCCPPRARPPGQPARERPAALLLIPHASHVTPASGVRRSPSAPLSYLFGWRSSFTSSWPPRARQSWG